MREDIAPCGRLSALRCGITVRLRKPAHWMNGSSDVFRILDCKKLSVLALVAEGTALAHWAGPLRMASADTLLRGVEITGDRLAELPRYRPEARPRRRR